MSAATVAVTRSPAVRVRTTTRWLRSDALGAFLIRRLLLVVPIMLGISIIVFALLQLAPGDPVASLAGPYSTPQQRAQTAASLGLDRPVVVQYGIWLGRVLHGDLGTSISDQSPITGRILHAFGNTLILATFAGVFALIGGIALGVAMARSRHRISRVLSRAVTVVAVSTPQYAVALLLIAVVAIHVTWFPTAGIYSTGSTGSLGDLLRHLILPGITAGLVTLGIIARITRSAMLEVTDQGWVTTLRSRGYSRLRVLGHVAHNMVPPLLTVVGLQFGYLVGGALFVEIIFSWPGMGQTIYNAIAANDYPLIQGGVLVGSAAFVLVNVGVDVVNALIDPRTRSAAAREST